MTIIERGLRVADRIVSAKQTIHAEINTLKSAINKLEDVFGKLQTEMITPKNLYREKFDQ